MDLLPEESGTGTKIVKVYVYVPSFKVFEASFVVDPQWPTVNVVAMHPSSPPMHSSILLDHPTPTICVGCPS